MLLSPIHFLALPSVEVNIGTLVIGARLSEPHTNGTALQKCVNVRACLRPYNVNFKCPFKYFVKIERPCALGEGNAGLLPECSIGNCSRNGSSFNLTSCLSQHLWTDHQRQTTRRPYKIIHAGLKRSFQVRVMH